MLKLIHEHKIRTGLGARAILKAMDDIPKGLTEKNLVELLSGRPSLIEEKAQRAILDILQNAPDKRANLVVITPEIHKKLEDEFKRTGFSPQYIMKEAPKHPDKPDAGTLHRLCTNRIKTICGRKLDYIFKQYEQWPDNEEGMSLYAASKINYDPLSKKDIEELKLYRDLLNLLPGHIFKIYDDAPEGLTPHMVSGWLNDTTKNANSEFVEWVLERCRETVKKAYKKDFS